MKRIIHIMLGSLVLFPVIMNAQDEMEKLFSMPESSNSQIATGSKLGGLKYYIKIVPIDTSKEEHMPRHNPSVSDEFVMVDHPPMPLKQVRPEYPEKALSMGLEGLVWVKCLIDKDGNVTKTSVISASDQVFIKPAVAAALQWKFVPAQLDGRPVEVWAAIPFRFKIHK